MESMSKNKIHRDIHNIQHLSILKSILDSIKNPVFSVDKNFKYTSFNKAHASMMKLLYNADILLNNNILNYMTVDEDREKAKINILKALEGEHLIEEAYSGEEIRSRIYFEVTHDPIYDEKNEIIGTVVSAKDITLNKKTSDTLNRTVENLKDSEEKFRNLFNNSPVGKSLTSIDGSLHVNKAFCDIVGYTEEELKLKTWMEISHPDDIPLTKSVIQSLLDGKTSNYHFEKRYLHKNGNIIWADVSTYLQKDKDGKAQYFITNISDITRRKQTETEINEAKENLEKRVIERTAELMKMKQLLDETGRLAKVGGWEIDLKTGKNYWSETTKIIHEVEPDFDPNLNIALNFYAPESLPIITGLVDRLIKLGESFDVELVLITAKKNRKWVRAIGQAYWDDEKIVKIAGVIQDINERKLAEQERENLIQQLEHRSSLLKAANSELEAFSYSVSHDLRAPLRGINGFVQILMEDYAPKLDEEAFRICSIIAENSKKMARLIDDLLAFSRLSRADLNLSEVDMKKLINSMYYEITDIQSREKIELKIGDICNSKGDPIMLRQVWINLISNAIKYSSRKEKAVITISCKKELNNCVYCIKDNGVGFNMKYMNKLFGVFQRLHSSAEFEGTGVGLAIVQRIIHRHGGKVWAEGEVDNGASFYFSLPSNNV